VKKLQISIFRNKKCELWCQILILGMYGDIQGIIGASLPEIKSLEMEMDSSLSEGE